jgi:hypothetical protein
MQAPKEIGRRHTDAMRGCVDDLMLALSILGGSQRSYVATCTPVGVDPLRIAEILQRR